MNLTLIFTEGAHDIAFIGKILAACPQIKKTRRNLTQLPGPLGVFFGRRVARLAIGDYRLDQALSVGMPRLEAAYETIDANDLWLLLKCGGDETGAETQALLNELKIVLASPLNPAGGAGSENIDQVKVIHVFDADSETQAARLTRFNAVFGGFYSASFSASGQFYASSFCAGGVMCCVIGGEPQIKTLEDLVLPLAKNQHGNFISDTDALLTPKIAGSKLSDKNGPKFKKALLTIVGQFEYPGASLAAVLAGGEHLLAQNDVKGCPRCTAIFRAISGRASW